MEEGFNYFRMIEEGQLLKLQEVMRIYNLTKEEIRQAVKSCGITKVNCYGADYFYKDELDLYISNTLEDLMED